MYKKHTKEEWAKALELYKKGYGTKTISRVTSINEDYLWQRCRQYNLTGRWYTERKKKIYADAELKTEVVNVATQQSLSLEEIMAKYGISRYCLQSWLRKYRHGGYEELLATKPKGRRPKVPKSKCTKGMSELERLREENEYLKAENAYLKKLKALDQEESAEMFGIGPKSSMN
jgi:transposase